MAISATSSHFEKLASNVVEVERPKQKVTYDPRHDLPQGMWLCTFCKARFYGEGGSPAHRKGCPKLVKSSKEITFVYHDSDLIFVVGDQTQAKYTPFLKEEISKVIEQAKKKFLQSKQEPSSEIKLQSKL